MAIFGLTGETLAIVRIFLVVVPAFWLFGYNQSNLGGVLAYPSFTKYFPEIDSTNTEGAQEAQNAKLEGTVVAVYTLGCLIGALGIAPIGNHLGRRKSLMVVAVVASIGLILQASAHSLAQLVVGRIISGVGNGGVNSVVPVWQSECTKPKNRGKNVVVVGIFITSGIALGGWVNVGLSHVQEQEIAWRLPLALPLIFTSMLLVFPLCFPESPRWLISKGRIEEARQSMTELNSGKHAEPESIDAEISLILSVVQQDSAQSELGFRDFFKRGPQRLFYRLCLAIAVNFCAQMTGANVISYYGTRIFKQSLHMPASKAALLNAGVLSWKIVAATSAFLTVDRLGRKPLFMIACGGMSLSMAGLAGTAWAIDNAQKFGASVGATFFLFLYMAFFPLGFVGANFLYSAEIAPQGLRIHLASVGTATHWLFNFVIAEITPSPLSPSLGDTTSCLSLEDMDRLFSDPAHFWEVPSYARKLKSSSAAQIENEGKVIETVEQVEMASYDRK
ncbi:hypothetical protein N8I77_004898 [Diaporthe amygdali]|uniref:Major facilitator superfamily (MFS) profile domain-containing protein n=1 Tax=Phomopsis amygdali TaxID=1214568 RepID=A0AAD9SKQ8_PHOAM|nr:hypothetical protein N8I77_004898 [Diaporthe amygdali]